MTSELIIITPEVAPGSGGVADHTLALVRQWRGIEAPRIIAASPSGPGSADPSVQQLGLTSADILDQLPKTGGRVFVQYSAYGFNRFGYPRDLIRALIEWKKQGSDAHLVVMFHEIWAFWPFTNKNFVIQQFHRRAIRKLLGVCDAAFTTTPSQTDHLQRLRPGAVIQVVPVGSNIQRSEQPNGAREDGCAVLFGLQTTRIRALEHMQKNLAALAAAGRITRIVTVGHGSNPGAGEREHDLLQQLNLSRGFIQSGALPREEVSKLLNSASFGIFGQNELSCQKSGSFMAYAAHGLNVIAEFADPAKPPPVCWLVGPTELLNDIGQAELDRRAECLRMWQDENCSWKVIGNKLGRALRIMPGPASDG